MSIAYFVKQIQPGEKILKVIYKSPWFYLSKIIFSIVFIWGGLFLYYWLDKKIGSQAIWLSLFLLIVGIGLFFGAMMRLKYTAWVITTERLLDFDQKSFWKNEINEVPLAELHSPVMIRRGVVGALFGFRTLRVFLTEEKAFLEIDGIKKNLDLLKFLEKKLAANEIHYHDDDVDDE